MRKKNKNFLMNSDSLIKLYSIDEMRDIILQERARSDRSSKEFSVIVFDIRKDIKNSAFLEEFYRFLESKLRSIDEVGWFSVDQVGVVLPYTKADNASRLAKRIQRNMKNKTFSVIVNIFTYPAIWPFKTENDQQNKYYSLESFPES